jgi:long-chain acyl-CoA synthetase
MNTNPLTLVDAFYRHEAQQPDQIYLRQPVGDEYLTYTWAEVGQQARRLVSCLRAMGLPPGSHVGLLAKNTAHWIIADVGIMLGGYVSVPLYPTLNPDQLRQVLTHSQCAVLLVGKLDNWPGMKAGVPDGLPLIALPGADPDSDPNPDSRPWAQVQGGFAPMTGQPRPDLDDLYTVIYTSGTTGVPKGVMIDHRATVELIGQTRHLMRHDIGADARFFSYLPLCHVAERNVVESTSLITGGTVFFTESPEAFARNLMEARPTHFIGVPRIWARFQQAVLSRMPQTYLDTALANPEMAGAVKKQIRQGLGLDNAAVILTGAAPMPTSLIDWFRRLDLTIREAYGMTENVGAVSLMPPDQIKDGTVGRVNPGMEVRFDPDTGELHTRSGWLMRGYYRAPDLTADVLSADGWLRTGDVGHVDAEGFLTITGRVKEMYKTAKGEYVSPSQIEFGFADNPFIDQVCVVGDGLPQPIALVVLSEAGQRMERFALEKSLLQTLDALNPRLHVYERVRKIVIVAQPWTVENNRLTPTMKLKRNVVEADFAPHLPGWYYGPEVIVWEGS